MRNKFPKIRILFALAFFLFSLAFFVFLYTYVNKKNTNAILLEEKWQIEEFRRENLKSLENFLELESVKISDIDHHFVGSGDVVTFLDLIEGLGVKAGAPAEVTLIDIPKDSPSLLIEVRSKGSFDSVYKFLSLLENAPYELEIVSMKMSTSKGESGASGIWDATFRVKLISFI